MRGGKKEAAFEEKVTIDFAFSTVVTLKKIEKAEKFSKENLWVKRPGTGEISAENYKELLGKKASVNLEKDTHLKWSDIMNEK
jgi:N-acetylneuraminate synthase